MVRDFLGNPPPGAPGVEVNAWFPSHPRLQFPLGETVRPQCSRQSLNPVQPPLQRADEHSISPQQHALSTPPFRRSSGSVSGNPLALPPLLSHAETQCPVHLQVDVVVGFSNGGEEAYNVTGIAGSLHSSAQWNLWVQNFTAQVGNPPPSAELPPVNAPAPPSVHSAALTIVLMMRRPQGHLVCSSHLTARRYCHSSAARQQAGH